MMERTLTARSIGASIAAVAIGVLACFAATQSCARTFNYQSALGRPLLSIGSTPVYPPFAILGWSERWSARYPRAFFGPKLLVLLGFAASAGVLLFGLRALAPPSRPFGAKHWGGRDDAAVRWTVRRRAALCWGASQTRSSSMTARITSC